jgi:hypothetical protein
MKTHHLMAVLLWFAACSTPVKDQKAERGAEANPKATGESTPVGSAPVLDTAHAASNVHAHKRVWIQYKRAPVVHSKDTLPYSRCTIELQGSRFLYSRDKQLVYEDEVHVDTSFKYRVYGFRDHPDDKLVFLDDKGARVVLKRDHYDGDYEYFEQLK